jgi:hypothetical protein
MMSLSCSLHALPSPSTRLVPVLHRSQYRRREARPTATPFSRLQEELLGSDLESATVSGMCVFELDKQRRFKSFPLEEFRRINDQARFVLAAKERSGDEFDQRCYFNASNIASEKSLHNISLLVTVQSIKRPPPFLSPKPMRRSECRAAKNTSTHFQKGEMLVSQPGLCAEGVY